MNKQTKVTAEPGKQEIFITREFDASRERVFEAFVNPASIVQWFLPKEFNMKVDSMKAETGGSYHYSVPSNESGFSGVYHEVLAPERIIKTYEFIGLPVKGQVALQTTIFEELPDNRTRVTIQFICPSVGYRDGMIYSGMERNMTVAYDQLDTLLV